MIDFQEITNECKKHGFDEAGIINAKEIDLLDEVRGMCESNRCGLYGKNWACPPYCGSLEQCKSIISEFDKGIIAQTINKLEDSFDYEGMEDAAKKHNEIFVRVSQILKNKYPKVLSLGVGGCKLCKECTCPDNPCRFPDEMYSSMEAYGIMVNDVCKKSNLKYNNGIATVTYISCYLIK